MTIEQIGYPTHPISPFTYRYHRSAPPRRGGINFAFEKRNNHLNNENSI